MGLVVALDSFYRDLSHFSPEERAVRNFDALDALDWEMIGSVLKALKRGEGVTIPEYDFSRHVRRGVCKVFPAPIVILEGLHALHRPIPYGFLDLKVFLEVDDTVSLERRLVRDVTERARPPEFVQWQFETMVKPMADNYVKPAREFADITLDGTQPLSVLADRLLRSVEDRLQDRGSFIFLGNAVKGI